MKRLAFLAVLLPLAGCASPERIAQQDDSYCQSIGAPYGTQNYMNCRLMLGQQRENRRQAASAAMVQMGTAMMAASQPRPQTVCTTMGNVTTCQ